MQHQAWFCGVLEVDFRASCPLGEHSTKWFTAQSRDFTVRMCTAIISGCLRHTQLKGRLWVPRWENWQHWHSVVIVEQVPAVWKEHQCYPWEGITCPPTTTPFAGCGWQLLFLFVTPLYMVWWYFEKELLHGWQFMSFLLAQEYLNASSWVLFVFLLTGFHCWSCSWDHGRAG